MFYLYIVLPSFIYFSSQPHKTRCQPSFTGKNVWRFGQRRLSTVDWLLSTPAPVKSCFLTEAEYLALPHVCLSILSSLKVIASEYPQLCYRSIAHRLQGDIFWQKLKLTFIRLFLAWFPMETRLCNSIIQSVCPLPGIFELSSPIATKCDWADRNLKDSYALYKFWKWQLLERRETRILSLTCRVLTILSAHFSCQVWQPAYHYQNRCIFRDKRRPL